MPARRSALPWTGATERSSAATRGFSPARPTSIAITWRLASTPDCASASTPASRYASTPASRYASSLTPASRYASSSTPASRYASTPASRLAFPCLICVTHCSK